MRTYNRTVVKNTSWTIDLLREAASPFTTRKDFEINHKRAYCAAQRKGLLDAVCAHMTPACTYWTNEDLTLEAAKYAYRSDFVKHNRTAYFTALTRGILDKICTHMPYKIQYWTNEELHQEALKYKNRSEFERCSNSAYIIGLKRKLMDQICSHMTKSCGISFEERDLLIAIQSDYPSAKKHRAANITVPDKPFIKGFDIDIFIPELSLGIEFDGTYWHSTSVLSKGRPWWPQEDILHYHDIKDSYFKSQGINILHITEAEWYRDKQATVQKCLKFLRGV